MIRSDVVFIEVPRILLNLEVMTELRCGSEILKLKSKSVE
jgi:hypothetical protein